MNYRIITYTVGKAVFLEGWILLIPTMVALANGESATPFAVSIVTALVSGSFLMIFGENPSDRLIARDGYVIVTLSWLALSAIGALPFYVGGSIPTYVDSFFEAVSGFTTTGASILPDVEALGKGVLFWRSATHWIGGMGVLVFILAIAERNPNRSINIMKAEMPGSRVDKLRPKAKSTAIALYEIYIGMTLLEISLLLAGGMSLYDSVVHAMGTAGTGGFGIYSDSIGGFSPYIQTIIAIFMMLFAVNFALYYLILSGRWRSVLRSTELKWFLSIIGAATAVIVIANQNIYTSLGENVRTAYFQVSSIISTTGYSTVDFDQWPTVSKAVLFLLMFIGGCEGSTAGGLKVSRVMLMSYSSANELKHSLHPRMIRSVRVGGKAVPPETMTGIGAYLALYLLVGMIAFLAISWEPLGFETNLTAVVSCLNNIGPGLAGVGPASNFAAYSDISKYVLSFTMLLGRLEIYPILLTIMREHS